MDKELTCGLNYEAEYYRLLEENKKLCAELSDKNMQIREMEGRFYVNILECDKDGFKEGHIYTDNVTHWMPLPQPPREE